MNRISIDESDFPLVVVTFPDGPASDDDIQGYIDGLEAIQSRGQRFFQLIDARSVDAPLTASQLNRFIRWAESASARMSARMRIGDGVVVVSPFVKGAMTAVFFFARPVAPTRTFTAIKDAARFAEQRFREEGIQLPDPVVRRLRAM